MILMQLHTNWTEMQLKFHKSTDSIEYCEEWATNPLIHKIARNRNTHTRRSAQTYRIFFCLHHCAEMVQRLMWSILVPVVEKKNWNVIFCQFFCFIFKALTSSVVGLIAAYSSLCNSKIKPSISKNKMWLSASGNKIFIISILSLSNWMDLKCKAFLNGTNLLDWCVSLGLLADCCDSS